LITSIGGAYAHLPAKRAVYAGTPGPSVAVVDANTYSSGDLSRQVGWITALVHFSVGQATGRVGECMDVGPAAGCAVYHRSPASPDAGWNRLHYGVPARDSICSRRRDPDRGSRHTGIPYEMTRANLMNGNKDLLGS
jgi:hypothetical protein